MKIIITHSYNFMKSYSYLFLSKSFNKNSLSKDEYDPIFEEYSNNGYNFNFLQHSYAIKKTDEKDKVKNYHDDEKTLKIVFIIVILRLLERISKRILGSFYTKETPSKPVSFNIKS